MEITLELTTGSLTSEGSAVDYLFVSNLCRMYVAKEKNICEVDLARTPPELIHTYQIGYPDSMKSMRVVFFDGISKLWLALGFCKCGIAIVELDIISGIRVAISALSPVNNVPVECLAALRSSHGYNNILAVATADCSIYIYTCDTSSDGNAACNKLELAQTIKSHPHFVLCMSIAPSGVRRDLFLFTGDTSGTLTIYGSKGVNADNQKVDQFLKLAVVNDHLDWIMSIDYAKLCCSRYPKTLLLATASQDKTCRVYKICPTEKEGPDVFMDENYGTAKKLSLGHAEDDMDKTYYALSCITVLYGHMGRVQTIFWMDDEPDRHPLRLLTASHDGSLGIWVQHDTLEEPWIVESFIGGKETMSGIQAAAYDKHNGILLGLVRNGVVHKWSLKISDSFQGLLPTPENHQTYFGNIGPATSVCWSDDGNYFLITSKDMTTRIYARTRGLSNTRPWFELSRVQNHGYGINKAIFIDNHTIASCAEEKVIRLLSAPKWLFDEYISIVTSELGICERIIRIPKYKSRVLRQPLGLATLRYEGEAHKSICNDQNQEDEQTIECPFPMTDHSLKDYTLWAEKDKLYGHSYELSTLAVSHDKRYLASSCKARTQVDCSVYIWDLSSSKINSFHILCHTLTITCIKFSHNDSRILTVSRDRSWALFVKSENETTPYKLEVCRKEAHSKMITGCQWLGCRDMFVTIGKDYKLKIWSLNSTETKDGNGEWVNTMVFLLSSSPSAIDVSTITTNPCHVFESDPVDLDLQDISYNYIAAVGYSDGKIDLIYIRSDNLRVSYLSREIQSFGDEVSEVAWKQLAMLDYKPTFHLAACSKDTFTRIYRISMGPNLNEIHNNNNEQPIYSPDKHLDNHPS